MPVTIDKAKHPDGRIVGIGWAVLYPGLRYGCPECGNPVRAHRESEDGSHPAHFEHQRRNPACSLSSEDRYKVKAKPSGRKAD